MPKESTIKVTTPKCYLCHQQGEVEVPILGYNRWKGGALIQNALPYLAVELREQLVTGTHPACWDTLMNDPDEDDE